MTRRSKNRTVVKNTRHKEKRHNIPPAEMEAVMADEIRSPMQAVYDRRNGDLDPQLVWLGKDSQDWHNLVVYAPPLYIQEKVQPKVLVDDLLRETATRKNEEPTKCVDLFDDFNGLPSKEASTEFYQHEANWANRMILGDSLHVMASLAEREYLRGRVQCVYMDPPYGIKFDSNFQWSTASREVKDGVISHITREPEVVKAFRDTWRDGIHSYMTYLRDRLTVSRDLLHKSGSIFVQIGDENVHRVRALMDEVFGHDNFVSQIIYRVKSPLPSKMLAKSSDYIIWYAKSKEDIKVRNLKIEKVLEKHPEFTLAVDENGEVCKRRDISNGASGYRYFTSQTAVSTGYTESCVYEYEVCGRTYRNPKGKSWRTHLDGMKRLERAGRLYPQKGALRYKYFYDDSLVEMISDVWADTSSPSDKSYVVETSDMVVQRCMLMTTDPGDLVIDPTCGSGTTAYTAEKWGRRWITIDTSRVALALARIRIMGAQFPYHIPYDSKEGVKKEAEIQGIAPSPEHLEYVSREGHQPDIRKGFVYERVPHITLRSIANNQKIDDLWNAQQNTMEKLRQKLNDMLGTSWNEWEIPNSSVEGWSDQICDIHKQWLSCKISRQQEIDKAIAMNADLIFLYDKPYQDNSTVRVAGPFTVESLSPHRVLAVDFDDELIEMPGSRVATGSPMAAGEKDFICMVIENLLISGVQQIDKKNKINFSSVNPWPGKLISADGRYKHEGSSSESRAAIFVGAEFGTVQRSDLVAAAKECAEAGFNVLISCAFSYSAQCSDLKNLGSVRILRARMNPDLHMADSLKNTGTANLFVVFGEPDIRIVEDGEKIKVKIKGIDVFKPQTGEVESCGPEGVACWFIDTNYNEESFFVRQAYFLEASTEPYKALKRAMKSEIDSDAWSSLRSDISRSFDRPTTNRIAVKVINHLGDEVMKVLKVRSNN